MHEHYFSLFFQAEDGIRYLVRSRGLGDVYKRQLPSTPPLPKAEPPVKASRLIMTLALGGAFAGLLIASVYEKTLPAIQKYADSKICLLYTSDAADERSSVDLGGRRIIKQKTNNSIRSTCDLTLNT